MSHIQSHMHAIHEVWSRIAKRNAKWKWNGKYEIFHVVPCTWYIQGMTVYSTKVRIKCIYISDHNTALGFCYDVISDTCKHNSPHTRGEKSPEGTVPFARWRDNPKCFHPRSLVSAFDLVDG